MDNNELIKIAITAVIAAFARELVTFIIGKSTKAAGIVKRLAETILKNGSFVALMIFDILVIFVTGWGLFHALFSTKLVTSSEVCGIGLNIYMWFYWSKKMGNDLASYITQKMKIPNKAAHPTAITSPVESRPQISPPDGL